MLFILALGLITFLYASGAKILNPFTKGVARRDQDAFTISDLAKAIDLIKEAAEDIKNNKYLTDSDRHLIRSELTDIIGQTLPESFLKKIVKRYGAAFQDEKVSAYVENYMIDVKSRLVRFQNDLRRKAASSLAWGLGTATLGLFTLAAFATYPPEGTWSDVSVIFRFSARLSLVALIEVVAFFFLSQYRFTLADEKYINNELTNVDFKLLGIIISSKIGNKTAIATALTALSKTERNFILKKGESTVFKGDQELDLLKNGLLLNFLKQANEIPHVASSTSGSHVSDN